MTGQEDTATPHRKGCQTLESPPLEVSKEKLDMVLSVLVWVTR